MVKCKRRLHANVAPTKNVLVLLYFFTMSCFNQQRACMYVCYIKVDLQRDNKIQEILH